MIRSSSIASYGSAFVTLITTVVACGDLPESVDGRELEEIYGQAKMSLVEQSEEEAREEDLALVAEAKGWSLEDAAAHLRATEAVGNAAVELAKSQPEIFVGSAVPKAPGERPRLYVKGPASDLVAQIVARSPEEIEVVDNQPFSFEEVQKRQAEVDEVLSALDAEFMTLFHLEGEGRIEVVIGDNGDISDALVESLLPEDLRGDVEISFVGAETFSRQDLFGGDFARDGGAFECTSGWNVRDGQGREGVTTAGHCDGIDSVSSEAVVHIGQHLGQWGDIEFKLQADGDHSQLDDFFASSTSIRDTASVEASAAISEGESICVYGRSSNVRFCSGDVDSVSVSCLGVNRLVRMDEGLTIGGDSGGGWSFNNTAYGSHVGLCSSNSVFSVADFFDEALGVSVMTSP